MASPILVILVIAWCHAEGQLLSLSAGEFGLHWQEPGWAGCSSGPCSSSRARKMLQEGPVPVPHSSSSPPTSLTVTLLGRKGGFELSWHHEPHRAGCHIAYPEK